MLAATRSAKSGSKTAISMKLEPERLDLAWDRLKEPSSFKVLEFMIRSSLGLLFEITKSREP